MVSLIQDDVVPRAVSENLVILYGELIRRDADMECVRTAPALSLRFSLFR